MSVSTVEQGSQPLATEGEGATTGKEADDFPGTAELVRRLGKWIEANLHTEEYLAFKQRQIAWLLTENDDREALSMAKPEDFNLPDDIERQRALLLSFLHLHSAAETLSQIQFYFGQVSLGQGQVSRQDHSRNMCEFYFSMFYVIRNRAKILLNHLKCISPHPTLDIGKILRAFDKEFDQELRERNRITHHEPYEEVGLEQMSITGLTAKGDEQSGWWHRRSRSYYERFCAEWSERTRKRALTMQGFTDAMARLILDRASFLQE